jgi:Na+/H+ antiporter NhaD/arsenite permease-like protein
MIILIIAVFLLAYLGMIFGGLPFVQLDRAGVALLGAIALVAITSVSIEDAWRSLNRQR